MQSHRFVRFIYVNDKKQSIGFLSFEKHEKHIDEQRSERHKYFQQSKYFFNIKSICISLLYLVKDFYVLRWLKYRKEAH